MPKKSCTKLKENPPHVLDSGLKIYVRAEYTRN